MTGTLSKWWQCLICIFFVFKQKNYTVYLIRFFCFKTKKYHYWYCLIHLQNFFSSFVISDNTSSLTKMKRPVCCSPQPPKTALQTTQMRKIKQHICKCNVHAETLFQCKHVLKWSWLVIHYNKEVISNGMCNDGGGQCSSVAGAC